MKDLLSIVSHFQMQGTVREIKPLGSGLINDTYKVTTVEADAPDYVLETGHVVMDGTGAELLTNERVRNAYLGG